METARLAAVVLAAGKGTRMKSEKAKVLHQASGRPLAAYPIKTALQLGASPVVVVVGHQAAEVETALRAELPEAPLAFAQQPVQLGTAHAVLCSKEALHGLLASDRVLILYGDVPLVRVETLQRLADAQAAAQAPLAMLTMRPPSPRRYGRLVRDAAGQL